MNLTVRLTYLLAIAGQAAFASPPVPVADFTASQTSICEGQCISFVDLSLNNPTSWTWTFQGGSPATSSQQNPSSVCYYTSGTYFVSLTVSNASGSNTLYLAGYIRVYPSSSVNFLPNGDFNSYNTAFTSQLAYLATGTLSPGQYSIDTNAWNHNGNWAAISPDSTPFFMADGSLTSGDVVWSETLSSVFPSSDYTFSFLMTNLDVNHTFIQPELITTITDQGGTVLFTGTTGLLPAQNTNNPPVFIWTTFAYVFSTLSNTTSITISLSQAGGQYLGFDFGLEDLNLKTHFCDSLAAWPSAAFLTDEDLLCPGTCADFYNLSVNATSCLWMFPGASPAFSTDFNPQNICYNNPGTYDVTLIASNAAGNDTLVISNYITVYPYPPPQGIVQHGDTLVANQGAVSYQWYLDGVLIPGATDYFYIANQSGNYNIVATDSNSCEVEAVIFDVVASVESSLMHQPNMTVYPNPSRDLLVVEAEREILALNIFNQIGEVVFSEIPESTSGNKLLSVNIKDFAVGIYWIELTGTNWRSRHRFMKQ